MKSINLKTTLAVSLFAVSSAFFTGCQKDQEFTGNVKPTKTVELSKDQERIVQDVANRIPTIRVYDQKNNRFIDVDFQNREFSFSEPNDGWNFSSSDDVLWQPAQGGGGILFIGPGALGGNTGGTLVAGNSTLDINYTFCFSASDEALGLDLFDLDADFDGISGVIGIAGDFEALANGEMEEDADFTDYFQGFAAYFVYDNEASGSYEILNWLEDLDSDFDDLDGKGFGFFFDFQTPAIYFTYDGTLNVSGGSIGFNGEYLGIEGLLFGEDEDDEPDYGIVDGFGAMGC